MIDKIISRTYTTGKHKTVVKEFQRGLDQVQTRSSYVNDQLYFRKWIIKGYNKAVEYMQAYHNGIPFKGSRNKIDYYV